MPPHMHPRSRTTSSLFATTIAASFLVVGLPHLLPCPAPRVAYADANSADNHNGNNNRRRARRRSPQQDDAEVKDGIARFESVGAGDGVEAEATATATTARGKMASTAPRTKRECPVPKPGGVIGEMMGFKTTTTTEPSKTSKVGTTEDTTQNIATPAAPKTDR